MCWIKLFLTATLVSLVASPVRGELRFERIHLDVGEIKTGKPLVCRYRFQNVGSVEARIRSARGSCGCLASKLEMDRYGPGQAGEIAVEVHTLNQAAGANAWTIHVDYLEGATERIETLRLTAHLVSEISLRPAAVTIFASSATAHPLTLTDTRDKPLAVRSIHASSERLCGQVLEVTGAVPRIHRIQIQIPASCPDGRHDDLLVLETDDPEYPELKVPVRIVKQPKQGVRTHPDRLEFLESASRAIGSRTFVLRSAEPQPIVIDHVTSDHPAFVATWAEGPGPLATVRVSIKREHLDGSNLQGNIDVHLEKPTRETVRVPVSIVEK